jgi:AraC-like DNA-binding protein
VVHGEQSVRFRFSTDSLPPEERFEAFRDNLARRLFQFDMIGGGTAEPYRGVIDMTMAGPVAFGKVHGSKAGFVRTEKMARHCEEGVWLLLNRQGGFHVSQGDMSGAIGPGDGFLLDAAHIHEGQCLIESDSWVIRVPEETLKARRPRNAPTRAAILPAAAPITRLLHTVLDAHYRLDAVDHQAAELLLGQYLADLVALAMGPPRDGAPLAEGRGLKAARLQAVIDDIGRNFAQPDLSATSVALRLGLSRRYVHSLLEETAASFSDHVLEHRLTHAHHLLTNSDRVSARIAEIAYDCGFSDLSFFNRSFRRRFGCSPRDARARGISMSGSSRSGGNAS